MSLTFCSIREAYVHPSIVERLNIWVIVRADLRQAQLSEPVGFPIISTGE